MNIRKPYYREFRRRFYETLGDKGDSILRYRGADNKEHYIASGNSPDVKPGGGMVETTWQELKDKRDAGKLIPGSLYRITDYVTMTTQIDTRSIGKYFDVVVLALSSTELSEDAWAMHSEGRAYDVTFGDGVAKCYLFLQPDGYYTLVDVNTKLGMNNLLSADLVIDEGKKAINAEAYYKTNLNTANLDYVSLKGSNVGAWKLKYCLDNDTNRFAWADNSPCIDVPASIVHDRDGLVYERYSASDTTDSGTQYYAWKNGSTTIFTNTLTPGAMNAETYRISPFPADDGAMITYDIVRSYTPAKSHPNGTGVIYRMVDEWGNDCPYDFKNIQFKRWKVTAADDESFVFSDENSHYFGIVINTDEIVAPYGINAEIEDLNDWRWCYTFDGYNTDKGEQYDFSTHRNKATDEAIQWAIEENNGGTLQDVCSGNVIECYANADVGGDCTMQKMQLGNNVFFATFYCHLEGDAWNYTFAETWGNTLGQGAHNNTLGQGAYRNTLGQDAHGNTLGPGAYSNTLGQGAYSNTLGQGASSNTLEQGAYRNTLEQGAYSNTLEQDAHSNTLGQEANSNTLGQGAHSNTLGPGAYSNTLEQGAYKNTLGPLANRNTLGANCCSIVFGSSVNNVTVPKAYCRYIRVETGVAYVNITTNATTSVTQYLQNIIVGMGLKGTSSNRKTITHATVNDAKQTTYLPTNSTTINV